MTHTEAIKKAMIDTGVKQRDIMEFVGAKTQSVISERINHKNISVKALAEILDAMGYEVVIQPKSADGLRADKQYVLSREDYV